MPNVFNIELDYTGKDFNNSVKKAIQSKWNLAIRRSVNSIQNRLKYELVFGGRRVNGFVRTSVYAWLKSIQGIGQIGLTSLNQLDDLLLAIADGTKVLVNTGIIIVKIFNLEVIAKATPHPATDSWFIDWIYEQKPITNAKFVPLSKLPSKLLSGKKNFLPRSFSIAGPESGLMLPIGSKTWRVPSFLKPSIDSWLNRNIDGIKNLMIEEIKNIMRTI